MVCDTNCPSNRPWWDLECAGIAAAGSGGRLSRKRVSGLFQLTAIFIPFAASGLEIEHQIFHVEPQLAQSVLDERQNAPAAGGAVHNLGEQRFDPQSLAGRQRCDGGGQLDEVFGNQLGLWQFSTCDACFMSGILQV